MNAPLDEIFHEPEDEQFDPPGIEAVDAPGGKDVCRDQACEQHGGENAAEFDVEDDQEEVGENASPEDRLGWIARPQTFQKEHRGAGRAQKECVAQTYYYDTTRGTR
jgi:hypothetical protein